MVNHYCMFKGKLKFGVPYLEGYNGNPHYAIVLEAPDGADFVVLANVKSDSSMPGAGAAGYHVLYQWTTDLQLPITADLTALAPGLHAGGFPRLDYLRDAGLVDFPNMRPIALDTETEHNDINALVDDMLNLDRTATPIDYVYHGSSGDDDRKGWPPRTDVKVYGFGFLFEPQHNGLHETHMNQGNPVVHTPGVKDHSRENGTQQDGAVIVEIDGKFQALLIAFQTQRIPTDDRGYPVADADPIPS
ncbi:MAG: DUF2278 family protein [Pseudomonadota bacterium]